MRSTFSRTVPIRRSWGWDNCALGVSSPRRTRKEKKLERGDGPNRVGCRDRSWSVRGSMDRRSRNLGHRKDVPNQWEKGRGKKKKQSTQTRRDSPATQMFTKMKKVDIRVRLDRTSNATHGGDSNVEPQPGGLGSPGILPETAKAGRMVFTFTIHRFLASKSNASWKIDRFCSVVREPTRISLDFARVNATFNLRKSANK